jgi:hypothetical protein
MPSVGKLILLGGRATSPDALVENEIDSLTNGGFDPSTLNIEAVLRGRKDATQPFLPCDRRRHRRVGLLDD